jgi:hypothetical protein
VERKIWRGQSDGVHAEEGKRGAVWRAHELERGGWSTATWERRAWAAHAVVPCERKQGRGEVLIGGPGATMPQFESTQIGQV